MSTKMLSSSITNMLPCSVEVFSNTVDAIYDCVLEPERWRDAVRIIAEILESPSSSVNMLDVKSGESLCFSHQGYPAGFWEAYHPYAAHHPIMPTVRMLPVGDVTTVASACGDEEFYGSRLYRDVLQPHGGYRDCIMLLGLRTGGRLGYLHACRTENEPRYSAHEIKIFKLFSKHICRAMRISEAFDLQTLKSESLEVTLDGLAAAVFLVARDLRVVYMNAAAEHCIKKGNALRLVNRRLFPTNCLAGRNLASALAAAIADEAEIALGDHTLAFPDRDGGLVVTILPLERGDRQSLSKAFSAVAAIFVQDPTVLPRLPGEAFGRLYGLTAGEMRVAFAMASGLAPLETAETLGIGLQTVKTHLQHIFQKTGTARQVDLVALTSRCAGPLRTA